MSKTPDLSAVDKEDRARAIFAAGVLLVAALLGALGMFLAALFKAPGFAIFMAICTAISFVSAIVLGRPMGSLRRR